MDRRPRVAVAVNRGMADSILGPETRAVLSGFADTNDLAALPERITQEDMRALLDGADAAVTCWGTPPLTDQLLAETQLRLVAHAAGSIKNLVPESFWRSGCRLTSNASIIAEDVAQHTLAIILCSLRGLWGFARSTRGGTWSGGERSLFATRRLDGLRVGVISASRVGRAVIEILRPFGCEVVLYDPYVTEHDARLLGVRMMELNPLIATSDVITLHAPPIEGCRHMINAVTAPMIKDGALFINTARGMLVDEAALIAELRAGRFFAAIDVTDPEPPAPDHPFRTLENVVLTPHIAGGHTVNGRRMLGANTVNEIQAYFATGTLRYEVRREMLPRMA